MNILLINHYVGSPKYGMEYRPYYIAREWVKTGHNVTIVGASFSHLRSQNPVVQQSLTGEIVDGIHYEWIKTPSYEGNGIGRIRNMISFIIQLKFYLQKLMAIRKFDVVIASSTYPLDIYPARMLKKKSGTKFVFEVHDLWPLSPKELGNIPAWHPYIMLMQKAENDAYRFCDKVVSILPCAKTHMVEHGLHPDKFVHIPNGISMDEWGQESKIMPLEHKDIIMGLKKAGQFVVGYTGSHGIANSLHTLLEAAELCKKDKVAFIMVGKGPEKNKLEKEVDRRKLSNVVFLPPVNKNSVASILDMFDICYVGFQKQPLFRFGVSPNKLMDYMMAAKPIIYAIEAGNDPVREAGCGISVPPEDPAAVSEALRRLAAMSRSERENMGRQGREYVIKNHDYYVIAQRFLEVLK
ncbi:glycosyltransferase family 4 protein [Syntrophomonas wolfei]|jgi:glycosyltransferase involved in cell wall biosynthesis|uniref:glycosyltransferase family 4 protein n=1 Tax=Syntrophomonas wolfei TaxID=863 RepID=UPI0023F15B9D|nr:glycosyltransferase family 4 protein [Syntrophomonas wolfei]